MKPRAPTVNDDFDDPLISTEGEEETDEDDLWFLPGPLEEEPDDRCCHIKCAESHEDDCVRRSSDARSDLPRVEGFEAVVSDLNCGTASGGNGETVAYG